VRKIVTHKLYCITGIIFVVSHTVHVVYELLCNLRFVDVKSDSNMVCLDGIDKYTSPEL
jgi:hypothetical protein